MSSITKSRARRSSGILRRVGLILFRTGKAFMADNVGSLGAALAFYTTLAIAPLLVLAIAAAGIVFNQAAARDRIITQITQVMGKQAGAALKAIPAPTATTSDKLATAIGAATLVFGALGVFNHLQGALNSIWRVAAPKKGAGGKSCGSGCSRARPFSLPAFLLLVSLIASAVLSWLGGQAFDRFGLPLFALQALNFSLSFLMITLLFAIIFKMLPDAAMKWRHVWLGSVATASLFTVGKGALGYYLSRASITSAYGAASSLVVLLLWCYYAAQIVFLGAELTRVVALSDGGRDFAALDAAPGFNRLS